MEIVTYRVGIFGSLLIPGVCAILSKKRISLPKVVVIRDSIGYILILSLVIAFLEDGTFYPLECLLFLGIFGVYLVLVFFSPLVRKQFRNSDSNQSPLAERNSLAVALLGGDDDDDDEMYCM